MNNKKPILVLDFDGVLHSYASGWQGAGVIPDPPVEGAADFCHRANEQFALWVVSSRCNEPAGIAAITKWLDENNFPMVMRVSGTKPAAFVTLDDRAITFDGTWPDVDELRAFQPWNKREASDGRSVQVPVRAEPDPGGTARPRPEATE